MGFAATIVLAAAVAAASAVSPAERLALRVEQRHRAARDLTARFTQTYRSGLLGRTIVEKGVVSIKPPGRMRWEYRQPEKKTFVADGKAFYFYVPADRQVIVQEQAGARGLPALLLSGRSDILREFTAALERGPGGRDRLKLVPKRPDPEVEVVYVEADGQDRIRAIEVLDTQGNRSAFEFADIRENTGLEDALFRFKVPAGVEVVTG